MEMVKVSNEAVGGNSVLYYAVLTCTLKSNERLQLLFGDWAQNFTQVTFAIFGASTTWWKMTTIFLGGSPVLNCNT